MSSSPPRRRPRQHSRAGSSCSSSPARQERRERREYRRDLRRQRRAVRRRMAVPPPPPLTEYDDGRAGSTVGATRGTRRARWKLALAALPLLFAAILFLVNVLGHGGDGHDRGDRGDGHDRTADGAATATAVVSAPEEISGLEPVTVTNAPVPPAGHRAVAVRFAAPDAVDLVAAGDRIDVVGLDGDVLAADLEVLQDRSTGQAGVLVVAVPEEHAPELAATAAARDLTLLVAHHAD